MAQDPNNPNIINQGQPVQPQQTQFPRTGTQGTGFTNIQRIVGANQGNRLGSTISGRIQQDTSQLRSNLDKSQKQFEDDAAKTREGIQQNNQFAQQAIQNAGTNTSDQDVNRFKNILQGQYQGPTGIQNVDQLQNQAANLQQTGQLAGSAGGRQALLQRYAGAPQYSAGQQKVDTLLLGQTGAQGLKQAGAMTRGLNENVNRINTGAQEQARMLQSQNQAQADQAKLDLQNSLNAQNTTLDTGYQNAQAAEKAKVDYLNQLMSKQVAPNLNDLILNGFQNNNSIKSNDISNIQDLYSKGYINQNDYNYLTNTLNNASISPFIGTDAQGNPISNPLLNVYSGGFNNSNPLDLATITQRLLRTENVSGPQNLTREGTASDEQIARLNALSKLGGGTQMIDPTRPVYTPGSIQFNVDPIRQLIQKYAPNYTDSGALNLNTPNKPVT